MAIWRLHTDTHPSFQYWWSASLTPKMQNTFLCTNSEACSDYGTIGCRSWTSFCPQNLMCLLQLFEAVSICTSWLSYSILSVYAIVACPYGNATRRGESQISGSLSTDTCSACKSGTMHIHMEHLVIVRYFPDSTSLNEQASINQAKILLNYESVCILPTFMKVADCQCR